MIKLKLVAEQLRRPHGFLGRIAGAVMERRSRSANEWTLESLGIRQTDTVLEVGFGPGQCIQRATTLASNGMVAGVDFSEMMVMRARGKNAAAVKAGRVALCLGDARCLPYRDSVFDKALGVNVLYFWDDPIAELRELRRVLRPQGTLALYFVDKNDLAKLPMADPSVFRLYDGDEVAALLSEAGFEDVGYQVKRVSRGETGVCAVAKATSAA